MSAARAIAKSLFRALPFKRQMFSIWKSLVSPSKKVYQHLTFQGPFTVRIDHERAFKMQHHGFLIENEIFWNGLDDGWEKYSMRLWKELCEQADTVFDVGANTGLYALVAQATRPNASVHAFEPVARVFQKLEQNMRLNGYAVKCTEKAISDQDGTATIYDQASEHILSVAVNKDVSADPSTSIPVEIKTTTLDQYIKQNNITSIDLMKIDVEGHEVEALAGFKEHLHKFQPTMLIEVTGEKIAAGIERAIDGMDYLKFNIDENSGVRLVDKVTRSDYYNFLLCKPEVVRSIPQLHALL